MLNEVFSDYFAQRKNYLTEVDARPKMLFVATVIVMIILSQRLDVPLAVFLLSLVFLLGIRIPPKIILFRLATPLSIAVMIFLIQIFSYGKIILFKWNLFGFNLTGYEEGLYRGFLIMGKVIGAVSLVIFLSMTTSVNKCLSAMRWFKIPNTWIEVALLTYRYIFVLLEDTVTIRDAQKVRLGYSSLARSLRSLGELVGSAVIRAYDHSVAAYEAMVLRGYNGTMRNIAWEEKFKIKDVVAVIIFIVILASLLVLSILPH